jgi:carbon starvation protein
VVSSFLYLMIGIVMGVTLRKSSLPLWAATAIFLPMVFLSIWLGTRLPASVIQSLQSMPVKGWEVVLLGYCFAASLIPVWLLLQPRGYLGGWFLYLVIGIGLIGVLFGGFPINYPAFDLKEGLSSFSTGKPLFPILFVTIACGACSGFHGIVASGTTSKQLRRESDARLVGYGAMLLESLTAILALTTLMILAKGSELAKGDPDLVYANGIASYLGLLGVDRQLALSFALLAFSTFIYDTLDVSTRLARYVVQELFSWKSFAGSIAATVASLAFPLIFLMLAKEKGYKVAWPIFGTSNQLLAALTLLVVSVWLRKTGRSPVLTLVPMVFIMAVTLASLGLQIRPLIMWLTKHGELKATDLVSGIVGTVLLALTLCLVFDAIASFRRVPKLAEAAASSS